MRILIVEDDEFGRVILESILEAAGHDVTVAEDGWDGLERFQKRPFGVVISDWQMPAMDGLTLFREIRKIQGDNKPRLVMITAATGEAKRQEAIDAGADDFISKPVDIAFFKAWCKTGLGKRLGS